MANINKPQFLIIHTEASPVITNAPRFDIVNQFHRQRLFDESSLGWYVGYHYFIEKSGQLIQARLDTEEGMHTKGYNLVSLGICLAGNGDMELPTKKQVETLKKLLNKKSKEYQISKEKIVPHRYFLEHHEKTCYGLLLKDDWAASLIKEPKDEVKIEELKKIELSLLQQVLSALSKKLAELLAKLKI